MNEFIKKYKTLFSMVLMIVGVTIVVIIASLYDPIESENKKIKKDIMKESENIGVQCTDIEITWENNNNNYKVNITLDNIEDYSEEEIFDKIIKLNDKVSNKIHCVYNANKSKKYVLSNNKKTLLINDEYAYGEKPTEKQTEKQTKYASNNNNRSSSNASTKSGSGNSLYSSSDKWVTETNDDYKVACWTLAKSAVKNKLKSPSSAKFPFSYSSSGVSIQSSGTNYKVTAYVEADNSFGAKIKTNFVVKLTRSGTGKNASFSVTSCNIIE